MTDPVGKHEAVAIDVEGLEESMQRYLKSIGKRFTKNEKIYRVFHSVRREHSQYYNPQIIAIGPFHRKHKALKPMERLKWIYLRQLIQRSEKNVLQNYINMVNKAKVEARSYYSEPVALSNKAFVEMMVLDGCFLIEYLVKAYMGENHGHLDGVNWNLPLVRRDLLLLENQFPFPILQRLYDSSDIPELFHYMEDGTCVTLTELAVGFVTRNKYNTLPESSTPDTIHHLLHVLHASMHPRPHSQDKLARWCCGIVMLRMKNMFLWLFYLFFYVVTGHKPVGLWRLCRPRKLFRAPTSNRNVSQLLELGVTFKKKSGERSTLDVSFYKETGIMEMPTFLFREDIMTQFLNLIAFEQCCPDSGNHITSYAAFMDSLIDTVADVNTLKGNQIIGSKNDEDKEVAEFFNKLCHGAYLNLDKHYLFEVFSDVDEYCTISHHRWRAELMPYYNYFRRPWALFYVLFSVFVLIPTMVQTFYTVWEYYRPSN